MIPISKEMDHLRCNCTKMCLRIFSQFDEDVPPGPRCPRYRVTAAERGEHIEPPDLSGNDELSANLPDDYETKR